MTAQEVQLPDSLVQQIDRFVQQVDALKISSQENYEVAAAYRKQNKQLIKEVENTFDPIADKQYEAWKETKKQMARHLKPLQDREAVLRRAMDEYAAEVERKRREEEQLRQAMLAEATGASTEEVTAVLEAAPAIAPVAAELKTPGTFFVEVWEYTVTDFAALPDEYKVPDHDKLKKVVNALKEKTSIRGLVVRCRKESRQRAR